MTTLLILYLASNAIAMAEVSADQCFAMKLAFEEALLVEIFTRSGTERVIGIQCVPAPQLPTG